VSAPGHQKPGDPFMSASNPLLKTEAMDHLRARGVAESEIQSLIAQAESEPA